MVAAHQIIFVMKLIITVDTEADNQWAQDGTVGLKNLDALPKFQSFVETHGFRPTYLASYETLAHPSLATLASLHKEGRTEIGGHLHPWTTAPLDIIDTSVQRFPSELPAATLDAKLAALTDSLSALLGESPYSFRAGRWGFDARVAKALVVHGYKIDSSVTPGISWERIIRDGSAHEAIPDFSFESPSPTWKWDKELLEVPITILPSGTLGGAVGRLMLGHAGNGFIGKAVRAVTRPRWCRIFPETILDDLSAIYKAALRENLPALVFMIHSSELFPGASPYAKDAATVERTYTLLGEFLDFLYRRDVGAALMREFAQSFKREQGVNV